MAVRVRGGVLIIEIGVGTLAYAFEHSDAGQPYDETANAYSTWRVRNELAFARDVARQLMREDEAGGTPLSYVLDRASLAALEDGTEAVELQPAKTAEVKP